MTGASGAPGGGLGGWIQAIGRAVGAVRAGGAAQAPSRPGARVAIGLLPGDSDAEIALNNLDEAEFPASNISVVSSDPARTSALTNTPGTWGAFTPRQLADHLQTLGMAPAESAAYRDALLAGQVLIAVRVAADTAAAAIEILTDQGAVRTRIVDEPRGAG